ncbi:MAG TPA: glycine cleavage T C-terminal barrel domain-containing protein, partial [Methylobacter sp.]
LKKGDNQFPGADKILGQLQFGPEKFRVGLLVDSKIPVREGSIICDSAGIAVGYVTSGSFSPSLGQPIAMALLDPFAVELDDPLYTMVRDHRITVTVTPLPFVPHRYHR